MRRALALLATLPGFACAEPPPGDPALTLVIAVSPTPATVGSARVLLTLSDRTGAPLSGATVVVSGRPPAGETPTIDTAREGAPGRYVAASFPFDTAGAWTLEARAVLDDGRVAVARHPIRVVGPPPLR